MGMSGAMDQNASDHETAPNVNWVQNICCGQSISP
jgi:hypothetical protein